MPQFSQLLINNLPKINVIGNEASQGDFSDADVTKSTADNSRAAAADSTYPNGMLSRVRDRNAKKAGRRGKAANTNSAFVKLGTKLTLEDDAHERLLEGIKNEEMAEE